MENMVKIEKIEVKDNFKYLWLQYITGINLEQHCKKSFRGKTSNYVYNEMNGFVAENIVLDKKDVEYYYLCGVTTHYVWENNFHLAFKKKEGNIIDIEENCIKVKILNAERIIFSEEDIDKTQPHADEELYNTCRNWQFAHWLKKHNLF